MPSLKDIKTQINSVGSTKKITSAMKMVAASKLRRSQEKAEEARPYSSRLEEMLSSEYQQRVKRHGESKPFEQFLKQRHFISSHHKKAAEVLTQISRHNIPITLLNYSRHKKTISERVFEAIGCGDLFPSEQMGDLVINRSLSQKELQMLMMINALYYDQFPWISARLSDALAKSLPNTETQRSRISQQSLEKLYEKNDPYLQIINSHLKAEEPLTVHQTLEKDRKTNNPAKRLQKIKQ